MFLVLANLKRLFPRNLECSLIRGNEIADCLRADISEFSAPEREMNGSYDDWKREKARDVPVSPILPRMNDPLR